MTIDNKIIGIRVLNSYLNYHYGCSKKQELEEVIFLQKSKCSDIITGSGFMKHKVIKDDYIDRQYFIELYIEFGFSIDELYLKNLSFSSLEHFKLFLATMGTKKNLISNFDMQVEDIKKNVLKDIDNSELKVDKSNTGMYIMGLVGLALIVSTIYKNFK